MSLRINRGTAAGTNRGLGLSTRSRRISATHGVLETHADVDVQAITACMRAELKLDATGQLSQVVDCCPQAKLANLVSRHE